MGSPGMRGACWNSMMVSNVSISLESMSEMDHPKPQKLQGHPACALLDCSLDGGRELHEQATAGANIGEHALSSRSCAIYINHETRILMNSAAPLKSSCFFSALQNFPRQVVQVGITTSKVGYKERSGWAPRVTTPSASSKVSPLTHSLTHSPAHSTESLTWAESGPGL